MADEVASEEPIKTKREELEALLSAMGEEQADAMDELQAYLASSELGGLEARLRTAVAKTIPGSMFESTINNTLTVLNALRVVLPQARASITPTEEAPATA
ncbi:hypothetical protein [Sphingobium yanoikuyae]|uniref:hypothetical protein n=1 Tax=Sphingobium yanoikuyae TaxID=13690 RepID=UPI0035C75C4E